MRQLVVLTTRQPLLLELEALAELYNAKVVCPTDFADLVLSNIVALVVDPHCLSADDWQKYLIYLQKLGDEDSIPLVVLMHGDEHETFPLPERIGDKQDGILYRCYDDDTDAITAIVEVTLLSTREHWNLTSAPSLLDVETTYIATHLPKDYVVVVMRPGEDTPSMSIFRRLAELAGYDTIDWASAAFLTFSFPTEENAHRFAAWIPAGMATLYAHGQYVDINC